MLKGVCITTCTCLAAADPVWSAAFASSLVAVLALTCKQELSVQSEPQSKTNTQDFIALINIWLVLNTLLERSQTLQENWWKRKQSCLKSKLISNGYLARFNALASSLFMKLCPTIKKIHAQAIHTASMSTALSTFGIAGVSRGTPRAGVNKTPQWG